MSDEQPIRMRRASDKAAVMVSILVAVLIALAAYFFWRGTGARTPAGEHAVPARTQP